jgi:hypothetical protein
VYNTAIFVVTVVTKNGIPAGIKKGVLWFGRPKKIQKYS